MYIYFQYISICFHRNFGKRVCQGTVFGLPAFCQFCRIIIYPKTFFWCVDAAYVVIPEALVVFSCWKAGCIVLAQRSDEVCYQANK